MYKEYITKGSHNSLTTRIFNGLQNIQYTKVSQSNTTSTKQFSTVRILYNKGNLATYVHTCVMNMHTHYVNICMHL